MNFATETQRTLRNNDLDKPSIAKPGFEQKQIYRFLIS